jgi:hypothetical protein
MSESGVMELIDNELANIIVPTALGLGAWQFYLLSVLAFGCALVSLFKFVRSVRYGGFRITSFRGCILILAFIALTYRAVITFVCFNPWRKLWITLWALEFPVYLQFVTFSVIILFLVKEQYVITGKERLVKRLLYPVYVVVILLLGAALVPFCVLISEKKLRSYDYDKELGLFTAILFGTSAIVMGTYGYLLHRIIVDRALKDKKKRRARRLMVVVTFYCCIFLARALWNILKMFDVNKLQDLFSEWIDTDRPAYYTSYLMFYSIAEILPVAVLLIFIDLISEKRKRGCKHAEATEQTQLIIKSDARMEKFWDILCCNCGHTNKVVFQETLPITQ